MKKQVFREVSLERLSSPEQLDSLMKITSPRGWLAFVAVGLLIVCGIIWGMYGSLPTKMNGVGVLIVPGGVQNIFSSAQGQVSDVRVTVNDMVNQGDVIARMRQPALLKAIENAQNELDALQKSPNPPKNADDQIRARKENLNELLSEYEKATRIVSPFTGRVLEVKVSRGDTIAAGDSVVTIERIDNKKKRLEAIMYIPVESGKKVIPGMEVQINPISVQREQYGFMLGRVTSVSDFPTTRQGMKVTLGNEVLVNQLAASGRALLEVTVELATDSRTESGFQWSSGAGAPVIINSGTLFEGAIVLKREKPLSFIIPQFN